MYVATYACTYYLCTPHWIHVWCIHVRVVIQVLVHRLICIPKCFSKGACWFLDIRISTDSIKGSLFPIQSYPVSEMCCPR